ncbi:hypothetical protein C8F01DRAFT_1170728 [Mycena amicta]|nr:hypothetical protein C8F01DRAFT_1170728 [Mycena amicta]
MSSLADIDFARSNVKAILLWIPSKYYDLVKLQGVHPVHLLYLECNKSCGGGKWLWQLMLSRDPKLTLDPNRMIDPLIPEILKDAPREWRTLFKHLSFTTGENDKCWDLLKANGIFELDGTNKMIQLSFDDIGKISVPWKGDLPQDATPEGLSAMAKKIYEVRYDYAVEKGSKNPSESAFGRLDCDKCGESLIRHSLQLGQLVLVWVLPGMIARHHLDGDDLRESVKNPWWWLERCAEGTVRTMVAIMGQAIPGGKPAVAIAQFAASLAITAGWTPLKDTLAGGAPKTRHSRPPIAKFLARTIVHSAVQVAVGYTVGLLIVATGPVGIAVSIAARVVLGGAAGYACDKFLDWLF